MKKNILLAIALTIVILLAGCAKKEEVIVKESAINFKNEYEAINGKTLRDDIRYRTLSISDNNPYVKVELSDIIEKLNNKETFYLYVGDSLCPWCRSGIEKMIEVANAEKIDTIYYIDFWDDDHKEILRDLYEVNEKNKVVKIQDAKEGYDQLLEAVKEFAQDYVLTKDGKEYKVGEKRVFGGDHFYFSKGVCEKYVSLRSDKLEKSSDELTEEVLNDQETKFKEFFTSSNVCTSESNC